jgi:hopanoid biosynthesis associated protein HpnK
MTRLLFNSDDFGKTSRVNSAILKAHKKGLLQSASLMVTGDAFQEAVDLARKNPSLKVGLHLALSEARPALPFEQVQKLTNSNGLFYRDPAKIGIKLAFCKQTQQQAKVEIQKQFELFAETKLPPAHVDGHHHLHMHPFIFKECIYWAEKLGFSRIRVAREYGDPIPPHRDSNQFLAKSIRHFVFKALAQSSNNLLKKSRLKRLDGVLGLWETGRMSEEYVLDAISKIPNGDWEIYFHIGSEGAEEEMDAILSPKLKLLIQDRNIQLL